MFSVTFSIWKIKFNEISGYIGTMHTVQGKNVCKNSVENRDDYFRMLVIVSGIFVHVAILNASSMPPIRAKSINLLTLITWLRLEVFTCE